MWSFNVYSAKIRYKDIRGKINLSVIIDMVSGYMIKEN